MKSQDVAVESFTRLSQMRDHVVERHEPDPRGRTVVNGRGNKVGEVKDLIVDTRRMTARYLDVELDTKLFDLKGDDPHILVPVGSAHIEGKHLVVHDITEPWIANLRAERTTHQLEFWDRWWSRGERMTGASPATRVTRVMHTDDLNRLINDVQPGETVRIPVVNEEIVVQRRPATDEETVVTRPADEPPVPQR